MTEETQSSRDNLEELMALKNRIMEDLEKNRRLLAEVEESIRRLFPNEGSAGGGRNGAGSPRVPTGMPRLDALLEGGFPDSSNILLSGPPYSSKFEVADHFIISSLEAGFPVIVVSLDRDLKNMREEISSFGISLGRFEEEGMLKFIDAYSRNIQMESDLKGATTIDNAGNTSNFLKTMDSICASVSSRHGKYRMVFFSLTGWITQTADERNFPKAFQHFSQRRKLEGATTLFLIEDGIFQKSLYENLNYFMDGAIEFRHEASSEYLRVRGLKNTRSRDWVEVINSGDGITLGSFELRRIS